VEPAVVEGSQKASLLLNLLEELPGPLPDLRREGLNEVGPAEWIDTSVAPISCWRICCIRTDIWWACSDGTDTASS
jgi:hypothetical protein